MILILTTLVLILIVSCIQSAQNSSGLYNSERLKISIVWKTQGL